MERSTNRARVALIWDTLVAVSVIPSTFFVTYQAIFNASLVWQWPFIYGGDVIYITSMAVNFFKSFTNSRGQLVTNGRVIVLTYLRTSFFYDFVSIIPFEVIAVLGGLDDLDFMVAVMRLNRLVRLYKVWIFLCKSRDRCPPTTPIGLCTTMEPPNRGHFGTNHRVLCREAVLLSEVSKYITVSILITALL
jgi:hypothetical protein